VRLRELLGVLGHLAGEALERQRHVDVPVVVDGCGCSGRRGLAEHALGGDERGDEHEHRGAEDRGCQAEGSHGVLLLWERII
jgi:hypothetical protein